MSIPSTPKPARRRRVALTAPSLLLALAMAALGPPLAGRAQEAAVDPNAEAAPDAAETAAEAAAEADAPADALLSAEALDELTAPIALYPDALLAQVLVAATYPLDIVKAGRWMEKNASLAGAERTAAADAEGWDPSVAILASGFPTVLTRMAEDLDWTEALGDALIVQTDDVMNSVQRQRGRAAAMGNLETNEAQTITVEDDLIAIAPADPQVVYVPAYDPVTTYTQPAAAAPVVVTDPADTGYSSGAMLTTGLIAFGAGMLVNELFDDDDDWNGYWGGGNSVNWNNGDIYARPGRGDVNINGDVTINRGSGNVRAEPWRADTARANEARAKMAARNPEGRAAARGQGARPASEREAARERVAARTQGGGALERGAAAKPATRDRAAKKDTAFAGRKDGLSGARAASARGEKSARQPKKADRAARPARSADAKPQRKAASKQSAFDRKPERSGNRAAASKSRGAKSGGGKSGGGRSGGGGKRR